MCCKTLLSLCMSKITLEEFIRRFQKFDAIKEADEIIVSNAPDAIRLVQNQLIDGEMPSGNPIGVEKGGEYRSPLYAAFKNSRNSRPTLGIPDLNLTGGNYNGIRLVQTGPLKYELNNINSKAPSLISKYGDYNGFQKLSAESFRRINDEDLCLKIANLFK